jgi:ABC-2 type transport system permease protein
MTMPITKPEGLRRTWIVAIREIRERATTRVFQISTVAAVLAIVALIVLPSVLSGGTKTYEVGFTGAVPRGTSQVLAAQPKPTDVRVEARSYDSMAAAEQALRDRTIDVLVVDNSSLEWRQRADPTLAAIVGNAVRVATIRERAVRLGISEPQAAVLLAPVPLADRRLAATSGMGENARDVGMVAAVLVFVAVSIYGNTVLTGVTQEKSNRVAEVLLARIRPRELLAGKVLGIGALGLAQFALVAAAAGVTARAVDAADAPQIPTDLLIWLVAWFVLGYAFYSVVYAGFGALASRVEDASSAAAPVSVLMFGAYFAALAALESPESTMTTLLSFLPPTAPFVMPLRMTLVAVPTWQVVASALLTALAVWLLVLLAGRIYSGALLRTGTRVPLRVAWRGGTDTT